MKANYNRKLKQKDITDIALDMFQLSLSIVTIALNEKYGFGKKRLEDLNDEINKIFNENFTGSALLDEQASVNINKRVAQIMKEGIDNEH